MFDSTAILLEESQVPSQQDPGPLIKSRSRDGAEQVTIGQIGNNMIYVNPGGRGILKKLEEMKRKVDILFSKNTEMACQMDEHQRQIDDHQRQISSLKSRVSHLVQISEGREGNIIAHEGDAFADAVLFDRDHRLDRSTYRELYGLDYQQVLDFRTCTDGLIKTSYQKLTRCIDSAGDDGGLFLVLNAHATMVAQGNSLPDDLKVAFDSFLAKVQEYWLQPPNKEPNTPLGSAYYTFWKKFNQQASC